MAHQRVKLHSTPLGVVCHLHYHLDKRIQLGLAMGEEHPKLAQQSQLAVVKFQRYVMLYFYFIA